MFNISLDARKFQQWSAQAQINIKNLPTMLHNRLLAKEGRLVNEALRKITHVPGGPVRPIRWKSQRQKRAYFASDGFGRGIPSRRSYKLLKGWRIEYVRTIDGGVISLTNPIPYMEFVQGSAVQPFHLDTGWVQQSDVMDDFYREAVGNLRATWKESVHDAVGADK